MAWLEDQGPDLLPYVLKNERTPPVWFRTRVYKHYRKQLYTFLYDQAICSGIGNYLRADIMYKAKFHPKRTMHSLSESDIDTLWQAIIDVIAAAIAGNGLTISAYHPPDNSTGTYKPLIYRKDGADYFNVGNGKNSQRVYFDANVQV